MKQRFHVFNHKIKLNPREIDIFSIYIYIRSNTVENQFDTIIVREN